MTRIKICGITSENDIRLMNKYLPDYVGFVFAESKRRVSAKQAQGMACALDSSIKRVGVFVDMDIGEAAQIANIVGLDAVQLHGYESVEYIGRLKLEIKPGTEIWKAFRITGKASMDEIEKYAVDKYLLDSFVKGAQGGTGVSFDWKLCKSIEKDKNIILAGGLKPSNICEAVDMVKPFAVDVSSGVEKDGKKDEQIIVELIRNVRG